MMHLLSYIPFVHPMDFVHEWWYLLIVPLAFGIAVIYKAVRLETLEHFWRETLVMTVQIVLGMIGLSIAVLLIVLWIPHMYME